MKEYTPEMFVKLWARAGLNSNVFVGLGPYPTGMANAYRSPKEKKLDRAQAYASEVRARKPQMQVRRKM